MNKEMNGAFQKNGMRQRIKLLLSSLRRPYDPKVQVRPGSSHGPESVGLY